MKKVLKKGSNFARVVRSNFVLGILDLLRSSEKPPDFADGNLKLIKQNF